jgi:predicted house-cleaning NTP pyrophosphatase (Maf/HAM1 superfamily)
MMGGLRNTTHQVYTANMVVFNQKPLLRYEWVEEANVLF